MEFVIKISQFLLSLSLLIVLHELGHFIPAKIFKTRVEKFYLFFDVKYSLFKKKIGETVYGIGWLPLGGYVKISGMIDESMDTEQMNQEPQPWEFRSKPSWQRLIIMLGGVTVNFVLAAIIYILMSYSYGSSNIKVEDLAGGYLIQNTALLDVGLRNGDKIKAINGQEIVYFSDIKKYILESKEMTIERNGQEQVLEFPVDFLGQLSDSKSEGLIDLRYPFVIHEISEGSANKNVDLKLGDRVVAVNGQKALYRDEISPLLEIFKGQEVVLELNRSGQLIERRVQLSENGKLGISVFNRITDFSTMGYFNLVATKHSLTESAGVGAQRFVDQFSGYLAQLKLIFSPSTGAYKGVGGFKAIFDVFPSSWSWQNFWSITAYLSIMLGILNLLPIPALDGGHVLFLLYEMATKRKPSDKFLEYAQLVGFIFLISLVLFANGNDIYKALFR